MSVVEGLKIQIHVCGTYVLSVWFTLLIGFGSVWIFSLTSYYQLSSSFFLYFLKELLYFLEIRSHAMLQCNIARHCMLHENFLSGQKSSNLSEMESSFKDMWLVSVRSSKKLTFYSSIKHSFNREGYLDLTNKDTRFNLTRLRISAHNLEIERGRYSNSARDERLCKGCLIIGISSVDDEDHLLYDCTPHGGLRANLPNAVRKALSMPPQPQMTGDLVPGVFSMMLTRTMITTPS